MQVCLINPKVIPKWMVARFTLKYWRQNLPKKSLSCSFTLVSFNIFSAVFPPPCIFSTIVFLNIIFILHKKNKGGHKIRVFWLSYKTFSWFKILTEEATFNLICKENCSGISIRSFSYRPDIVNVKNWNSNSKVEM